MFQSTMWNYRNLQLAKKNKASSSSTKTKIWGLNRLPFKNPSGFKSIIFIGYVSFLGDCIVVRFWSDQFKLRKPRIPKSLAPGLHSTTQRLFFGLIPGREHRSKKGSCHFMVIVIVIVVVVLLLLVIIITIRVIIIIIIKSSSIRLKTH